MGSPSPRRVWSTWLAFWLVATVAISWVFIQVTDANRAKRIEHLTALGSFRDGQICGTEVITKYGSTPVYEYMVRWHSSDPPAGMPAEFQGRFCGVVLRVENGVRTREGDGTYLVQLPGETSRVEAVVFAAITAGFVTLLAAMFMHRRRPLAEMSTPTFEDGAQL